MTRQKRKNVWTQYELTRCLKAVKSGVLSINKASQKYGISRRTITRYINNNVQTKKINGRKPVLDKDKEKSLCSRIFRLADVGFPLTSKVIKSSAYNFCTKKNIKHNFSSKKKTAGRKWFNCFLKRNADVRRRKSQRMNPARAIKLNKFIVEDYFTKLEKILIDYDLMQHPEKIYNMDEKGCRLNLHKEPMVYAKKGARRVHYVSKEHGESVTIVSCVNAIGSVIPPMILFKGKLKKPEWEDSLPTGSVVEMTAKGSMTLITFLKWIQHFAKYKPNGHCLLIFDGAKAHLDVSIVDEADKHNIILLCLPSNTTHELQPLDKSCFRPFEIFWNDEVILFLKQTNNGNINKARFGRIFTPVWDRAMSQSNIKSGFKATGIYPYNPRAIPEEAFAPSDITYRQDPSSSIDVLDAQPSTSTRQDNMPEEALLSTHDLNIISSEEECSELSSHEDSDNDERQLSFSNVIPSPTYGPKTNRQNKPAINSRAVNLTKDTFVTQVKTSKGKNKVDLSTKKKLNSNAKIFDKLKKSIVTDESWFCIICTKDEVKDMRLCTQCFQYVHEECVGLTEEDTDKFICPKCESK